ncbi:MAG: hypothetical protein ABUL62_04280 [Myxococcales bacterium]|jgi:hypothetical protein
MGVYWGLGRRALALWLGLASALAACGGRSESAQPKRSGCTECTSTPTCELDACPGADAFGAAAGGAAGTTGDAGASGDLAGAAGEAGQSALACAALTADCDGEWANGCEAKLDSDAKNCGVCGRACEREGQCSEGGCPVVTVGTLAEPTLCANGQDCTPHFTRDAVFFLRSDGLHSLPRRPKQLPVTSTSIPSDSAATLTSDETDVYWLRRTSPTSLWTYAATGASPSRSLSVGLGVLGAYPQLEKDDQALFFSRGFPLGTTIERLDEGSDGEPRILIQRPQPIDQFVHSSDALVWAEGPYLTCRTPTLFVAPANGGSSDQIRRIGEFSGCTYRLEINDQYLYWVDQGSDANQGKVRRIALNQSDASAQDLASNLNFPEGLAVDESYVYFTKNQEGSVLYRLKRDGSEAPTRITRFQEHLTFVDESSVWGYSDAGDIVRTPK